MAEYTQLGLLIKTKLLGPPAHTQGWLAKEVNKDTGLKTDVAEISKILTGKKKSQRVVSSICKILAISEQEQQDGLSTS